jgi:hypothetical protein
MEADSIINDSPMPQNYDKVYIPSSKVVDERTFVELSMDASKDIPDNVYKFEADDLTKAYNIGVDLYNAFIDTVDDQAEEVERITQISDQISTLESKEVTTPLRAPFDKGGFFPGFAFGLVSVSKDVKKRSKVIPILSTFTDKVNTQVSIAKKKAVPQAKIHRAWSEAYEGRSNNMQPFTIQGTIFPEDWAVSFRNKGYHLVESAEIDETLIETSKTEAESLPSKTTNIDNQQKNSSSQVVSGLLSTSTNMITPTPVSSNPSAPQNQDVSTTIAFRSDDWKNGKTVVWPYMLADNFFSDSDTSESTRVMRFKMLASIYNLNALASKGVSLTDLVSTPVNNKLYPNGVKVPGNVKWDQTRYKQRQTVYFKDSTFVTKMKSDWKKYISDIRKGLVA